MQNFFTRRVGISALLASTLVASLSACAPVVLGGVALGGIVAADRRTTQGTFHVTEGGLPIPADKKAAIESALTKLKDAHKSQDVAACDAAIKEVENAFQAAQQDIYNAQAQAQQAQQAQANAGANAGAANNSGDDHNVSDVDFEEVK